MGEKDRPDRDKESRTDCGMEKEGGTEAFLGLVLPLLTVVLPAAGGEAGGVSGVVDPGMYPGGWRQFGE